MSVADRIAAKVASLRPVYEDKALPDWCEVVRSESVSDGRGGHTTVRVVVEQTRCALNVSQRSGTEGIASDQMTGITIYTCDLPDRADVTDADTLRINTREFTVVSVGWEEGFAIGKTALLEARS